MNEITITLPLKADEWKIVHAHGYAQREWLVVGGNRSACEVFPDKTWRVTCGAQEVRSTKPVVPRSGETFLEAAMREADDAIKALIKSIAEQRATEIQDPATITADEIANLRRLYDARASKGTWRSTWDDPVAPDDHDRVAIETDAGNAGTIETTVVGEAWYDGPLVVLRREDAALIVALANAAPRLFATIEAQAAEIDSMKRASAALDEIQQQTMAHFCEGMDLGEEDRAALARPVWTVDEAGEHVATVHGKRVTLRQYGRNLALKIPPHLDAGVVVNGQTAITPAAFRPIAEAIAAMLAATDTDETP